jgi:hypothetical protein
MKKLLTVGLLCLFTALTNLQSFAVDEKAPIEEKKTTKAKAIPFRGKLAAVDKEAKTLKIGDRIFHVTSATKIMKAGKPATLDDAMIGEDVGGQYRAIDGGKIEALSVRLGAKPVDAPKPQADQKEKAK